MTRLRARHAASLVLAAAVLSVSAVPALASDPATDLAPGSAPVTAAQDLARAYWQTSPCGGAVSIEWMALPTSTNATSSWNNPVGQYTAPQLNSDCAIAFNSAIAWDWTRFCSILVHEYGHLGGHAHSDDPADVMYAFYNHPVQECVDAAPAQPVLASEDSTSPPAVPAAAPRTATTPRRVRRGAIAMVRRHAARHGKHRRAHHRRHRSARTRRAR